MWQMTWDYEGPDTSSRGMTRKMKRALDHGLRLHRRSYMRGHFKKSAIARYGGEYSKLRKRVGGGGLKAHLAKMNADEVAEFWAGKNTTRKLKKFVASLSDSQRARYQSMPYALRRKLVEKLMSTRSTRTRGKAKSPQDPKSTIPLVASGRLRGGATSNPATFGLPVSRRKLTISGLPWYLSNRPAPGKVNKIRALQETTPAENMVFASRVDRKLAELLKLQERKGKP